MFRSLQFELFLSGIFLSFCTRIYFFPLVWLSFKKVLFFVVFVHALIFDTPTNCSFALLHILSVCSQYFFALCFSFLNALPFHCVLLFQTIFFVQSRSILLLRVSILFVGVSLFALLLMWLLVLYHYVEWVFQFFMYLFWWIN